MGTIQRRLSRAGALELCTIQNTKYVNCWEITSGGCERLQDTKLCLDCPMVSQHQFLCFCRKKKTWAWYFSSREAQGVSTSTMSSVCSTWWMESSWKTPAFLLGTLHIYKNNYIRRCLSYEVIALQGWGSEFAPQKSCVRKGVGWDMVLSACNHSSGEADTGGSLGLAGAVYVCWP